MQIWAQYPYISFRLNIPSQHFERIEKAIFNAYPNAEINHIDKGKVLSDIAPYHKSYLSYGQSSVEGKFYHHVRTLKDVSSDPMDSIISTMEGLSKGEFMAYNITVSPTSHYFNQVIHYMIEEQDRVEAWSEHNGQPQYQKKGQVSELAAGSDHGDDRENESVAFSGRYFLLGDLPIAGSGGRETKKCSGGFERGKPKEHEYA